MDEKNRLKPWHGVVASLCVIVFMLFGGSLMYMAFGEIGGYLAGLVVAGIGLLVVLLTKTKPSCIFPFSLPPVRQFLGAAALFVGIFFLNSAVGMIQSQWIPNFSDRQNEISSMVRSLPPVVALLLIAVQPAVCEELFCRGFLVAAFCKWKHEGLIIFVTALFFGAMHLDLYSFIPTAIMGAFFAFLALRTHSLLFPMIFHFCNNAFSIVMAYGAEEVASNSTTALQELSVGIVVSFTCLYLGLALCFLWIGYRLFSRKRIFTKSSLIVFLLVAILVVVGYASAVLQSMRTVINQEEAIPYTESIQEEIPLIAEDGMHAFSVVAEAEDPVRICIQQGDEVLVDTVSYEKTQILAQSLFLTAGEYRIVILSEEGAELLGGTLKVRVLVVENTTT